MSEHRVFKTPLRPVIMMVIGLNCIMGDLLLAIFIGMGVYAAVAWMER